jgi:hypothetical protein
MISQNTPNKLSRRNWLRKAAFAATSAVVLPSFLTGCTDEQWEHLKSTPPPLGGAEDNWYHLKVTYKDRNDVTKEGYMGASGLSAGETDWDNMVINGYPGPSKFKLYPADENGFFYWEIDDGYWLSMRSSGWAYRSYEKQRIGWKIDDGKLYNSYWNLEKWRDYPMGAQWSEGLFTSKGYYVGVDLGDDRVLTNCVLELAQ